MLADQKIQTRRGGPTCKLPPAGASTTLWRGSTAVETTGSANGIVTSTELIVGARPKSASTVLVVVAPTTSTSTAHGKGAPSTSDCVTVTVRLPSPSGSVVTVNVG